MTARHPFGAGADLFWYSLLFLGVFTGDLATSGGFAPLCGLYGLDACAAFAGIDGPGGKTRNLRPRPAPASSRELQILVVERNADIVRAVDTAASIPPRLGVAAGSRGPGGWR